MFDIFSKEQFSKQHFSLKLDKVMRDFLNFKRKHVCLFYLLDAGVMNNYYAGQVLLELLALYEIKLRRVKSHQFDFINQRRLSFGQGVLYLLQMEAKSNIIQQKN